MGRGGPGRDDDGVMVEAPGGCPGLAGPQRGRDRGEWGGTRRSSGSRGHSCTYSHILSGMPGTVIQGKGEPTGHATRRAVYVLTACRVNSRLFKKVSFATSSLGPSSSLSSRPSASRLVSSSWRVLSVAALGTSLPHTTWLDA